MTKYKLTKALSAERVDQTGKVESSLNPRVTLPPGTEFYIHQGPHKDTNPGSAGDEDYYRLLSNNQLYLVMAKQFNGSYEQIDPPFFPQK